MSAWIWLLAAAAAGVAAYLVGWPAWQQYRLRDRVDANTERYLGWRGRSRTAAGRPSEGMTGEERRRVYVGVALGVVAIFCLVGFFTYAG